MKNIFLVTRRDFIYMDRRVHKITGIIVTEKQSKCLGAAAVRRHVRRRAGQPRPRPTAVSSRAWYLDDSVDKAILKNRKRYKIYYTDVNFC